MAVTFSVSPELRPLGRPWGPIDVVEAIRAKTGRVEAYSRSSAPIISCPSANALIAAMLDAFNRHYPLSLSPDAVWLTLARGFALHVAANAETLRHRFVTHSGQLTLRVVRTDFVLGQENPWPEAFESFSDQIAAHVGKFRDFVRADFSTTGPVERAVSDLMVMETLKPYFSYAMSLCGIPSITLEGTPADWRSIRNRAALFSEFGLEQWSRALDPVLEQFVAASEGRVEVDFWRSMFHYLEESGISDVTGWVTTFFPHIYDRNHQLVPNPCLADWQTRLHIQSATPINDFFEKPPGINVTRLPRCLTSVPLEVEHQAGLTAMRLFGGVAAVSQNQTDGTIRPEIGWAVAYERRQPV